MGQDTQTSSPSAGSSEIQDVALASAFKPLFHITAPNGWLNDPCGPGYDPKTGRYHLFFQWNPHGNVWGNMSWGHATSSDLVSWETSPLPALEPTADYDHRGVFTGCLRPTGINGNPGELTVVYTSVSHLPIHYTLPYVVGSETLSLAVSADGSKTWERHEGNPILPGPPSHLSVTGWRDPSFAIWDFQGQEGVRNGSPSNLYGLISGGIVGKTPTAFVYAIDPSDLRKWAYTGPLIDVGQNFFPSRWSGDFGVNWEVANLMTLANDYGESRDFIIVKVEGALSPEKSSFPPDAARRIRRTRCQHWMSIRTSLGRRTVDDPLTEYGFAGIFDHGCFLAANAFWDPITSQHIVYGWITEEDLSDHCRHSQGWSSLISIPRVARLMTLPNVTKARKTPLQCITSLEVIPGPLKDTFTIHTLSISPEPRLAGLRRGCQEMLPRATPLPAELTDSPGHLIHLASNSWELIAEFAVSQSCKRVGIEIAHDPDFNHRTVLAWNPDAEEFTIHRPPAQDLKTNHGFETAPHTLFTSRTRQGQETEEDLTVHAFFDRSVLEVFVNHRTVISTRVYHSAGRCFGVRFFAESSGVHWDDYTATRLVRASAWDGIGEHI